MRFLCQFMGSQVILFVAGAGCGKMRVGCKTVKFGGPIMRGERHVDSN